MMKIYVHYYQESFWQAEILSKMYVTWTAKSAGDVVSPQPRDC